MQRQSNRKIAITFHFRCYSSFGAVRIDCAPSQEGSRLPGRLPNATRQRFGAARPCELVRRIGPLGAMLLPVNRVGWRLGRVGKLHSLPLGCGKLSDHACKHVHRLIWCRRAWSTVVRARFSGAKGKRPAIRDDGARCARTRRRVNAPV